MKYCSMLFLIAALPLLAAGPEAKPSAKTAAPQERSLTRAEIDELRITQLKIHLLNDEYKISEYNDKVAPLLKEQRDIHDAACKSIGIPEAKIQTECGIVGFGVDGDPINGPDGKPVQQKVFRIQRPGEK